MAPIKVRVNTLFQKHQSPFVDPLSKYYIIIECILGLNRLPVILRRNILFYIFMVLSSAYSLFIIICIIYGAYVFFIFEIMTSVALCIEFSFCTIFSFVSWKRVYLFYWELSKFDIEVGCRPKTTSDSTKLVIFTTFFMVFLVMFHLSFDILVWSKLHNWIVMLIVIDMTHCLEASYYGHLLSLLISRLRIINYYMESTLVNGTMATRPNVKKIVYSKNKDNENIGIKKLMDLYNIIIKSFDLLMNAVKWQLLMIIVTTFIRTLAVCYRNAISLSNNKTDMLEIYIGMSLVTIQLLPLFSPCVFSDRVHGEVRKLRELTASRLYENRLDKAGRSTARALLALTEARDLSFSLLRMLRVDVALPFKFIGLMVTYLIILLQFDKVIHPASPTVSP